MQASISKRIIILCYVICGLCAGIVNSSRITSADSNNIGLNYELDAILAVALGGGRFNLAGSVIGAYTIQAITTTLYALGVSSDQTRVYKAVIVIIIVAIQAPPLKAYVKQLSARRAAGHGKEAAGCVVYANKGFTHLQAFFNLLITNAGLICVTCGMTCIMLTGGIDISVGSLIALDCMILSVGMDRWGWGTVPLCILILAIGVVFGMVQGFLIGYLDIQPFIVTMAGMFFARGLTAVICTDQVSVPTDSLFYK